MVKKIIWTRSKEDYSEDLRYFFNDSCILIHLPCTFQTPLPYERPHIFNMIDVFDICILTSPKCARFALGHPELYTFVQTSRECFTVGSSTQDVLRTHDIDAIIPPGVSYAKDLSEWLKANRSKTSTLLILGPETPAFDLQGELAEYGWNVTYLAIYRTLSQATEDLLAIDTLVQPEDQALICFASPSAVHVFLTKYADISRNMIAIVIGETTYKSASGHFRHIYQAPKPTLAALAACALSLI